VPRANIVNDTLDALVRRLTIFVGATFGTFVVYLAIGEVTGLTDGTPIDNALSAFVIGMLAKTTVILSAGHAIALALLAWSRRGYVTPPLRRSAMSGVVCATALDMVYVSGTWLSASSERGLFRLILAACVSLAICARRSRRQEPNSSHVVTADSRGIRHTSGAA
jgi:hypothetical protein